MDKMEWIDLGKKRDWGHAVVNTAMNLRFT